MLYFAVAAWHKMLLTVSAVVVWVSFPLISLFGYMSFSWETVSSAKVFCTYYRSDGVNFLLEFSYISAAQHEKLQTLFLF